MKKGIRVSAAESSNTEEKLTELKAEEQQSEVPEEIAEEKAAKEEKNYSEEVGTENKAVTLEEVDSFSDIDISTTVLTEEKEPASEEKQGEEDE